MNRLAKQYFEKLDTKKNGFLTFPQVKDLFLKSKLPNATLNSIWKESLSHSCSKNGLDVYGFDVAFDLIKKHKADKKKTSAPKPVAVTPNNPSRNSSSGPPKKVDETKGAPPGGKSVTKGAASPKNTNTAPEEKKKVTVVDTSNAASSSHGGLTKPATDGVTPESSSSFGSWVAEDDEFAAFDKPQLSRNATNEEESWTVVGGEKVGSSKTAASKKEQSSSSESEKESSKAQKKGNVPQRVPESTSSDYEALHDKYLRAMSEIDSLEKKVQSLESELSDERAARQQAEERYNALAAQKAASPSPPSGGGGAGVPPAPSVGAPPAAPPVGGGPPPAPPIGGGAGVPGAPPVAPPVSGSIPAPPAAPQVGTVPSAPAAPRAAAPPSADPHGGLLAAIRQGKKLKKTEPASNDTPSSAGGGGIGGLLGELKSKAGKGLKKSHDRPAEVKKPVETLNFAQQALLEMQKRKQRRSSQSESSSAPTPEVSKEPHSSNNDNAETHQSSGESATKVSPLPPPRSVQDKKEEKISTKNSRKKNNNKKGKNKNNKKSERNDSDAAKEETSEREKEEQEELASPKRPPRPTLSGGSSSTATPATPPRPGRDKVALAKQEAESVPPPRPVKPKLTKQDSKKLLSVQSSPAAPERPKSPNVTPRKSIGEANQESHDAIAASDDGAVRRYKPGSNVPPPPPFSQTPNNGGASEELPAEGTNASKNVEKADPSTEEKTSEEALKPSKFRPGMRVVALYPFEGEVGENQLSYSAGDVFTLVSTEPGQGWWKARCASIYAKVPVGYVAENYIDVYSEETKKRVRASASMVFTQAALEEAANPSHSVPGWIVAAIKSGETIARVEYQFAAQGPGQLTVAAGDHVIVQLPENEAEDDGWCSVRLGSEAGILPTTYIKTLTESEKQELVSQASAMKPEIEEDISGLVVALYDYASRNESEMSVTAGQVLQIENKITDDWWELSSYLGVDSSVVFEESRAGLVPASYVEAVQKVGVADFDYEPEEDMGDNQLELERGDRVYVYKIHNDVWWEGTILSTDGDSEVRKGLFPAQYLVEDASESTIRQLPSPASVNIAYDASKVPHRTRRGSGIVD